MDRLRTQNYYINSVHGDWPAANLKLGAPLLRTFCSQWLFAAISEILYRRSDFVSGKFNDLYKVKLTPRPKKGAENGAIILNPFLKAIKTEIIISNWSNLPN